MNARWGNLMAILAGDFLLAQASEIAASLGTEVAGLLAATIGRLCEGQVLELQHAFDVDRTEDDVPRVHRGQDGGAVRDRRAASAAIVGELPRDRRSTRSPTFGRRYGMAFQIVDDVLDVIATDEQLGKPAGHDLVEGVYTLPVLHALRGAAAATSATLLGGPIDGAELDTARRLVRSRRRGRRPQHRSVARRYIDEAVALARPVRRPVGVALARRRRSPLGSRSPPLTSLALAALAAARPRRARPSGRRALRRRGGLRRMRSSGALLTGIAAFRWLAWAWMAFVAASSSPRRARRRRRARGLAVAARSALRLVVTAVDGVWLRPHRPGPAAHDRRVIVAELAVGLRAGCWRRLGVRRRPPAVARLGVAARRGPHRRRAVGRPRRRHRRRRRRASARLFGDLVEVRNTEPIGELDRRPRRRRSCSTPWPAGWRATPP